MKKKYLKGNYTRGQIISAVFLMLTALYAAWIIFEKPEQKEAPAPEIRQEYLTKNSYSRSGIRLRKVRGIVVHYVGNPGSSAKDNRDYFENLGKTHLAKASSHFVIGLEGEIIQCIPLDEIAYASNERNSDTISIECCHKDKGGRFHKKTYDSLIRLCGWLCTRYGLDEKDVIRHYDVTGKDCPRYYVRHPDAWKRFLKDLKDYLLIIAEK